MRTTAQPPSRPICPHQHPHGAAVAWMGPGERPGCKTRPRPRVSLSLRLCEIAPRFSSQRPRSGLAADELAQALRSGGFSATWRLQNPVRGAGMSGSSRVLVAAQRRSCRLVRSGFTNQTSRRAWRGAVRCVEAGRGRGRARRDAEGARCGKRRLSGGRCWLGVRGRIEGMEAGSSLWAVVWECRDGVWR